MKRSLLLSIAVFFSTVLYSQKTLYYFSGSDWCSSCIKFKKEKLNSDEFKSLLSKSDFTYEVVDFPQRQKGIPKSELKRRDSLAAIYNSKGEFPSLVVVNGDSSKRVNHNSPTFYDDLQKLLITSIKEERFLMGSNVILEVEGDESELKAAWATVYKYMNLISSWDSLSITHQINRNAGIRPVKVSNDYLKFLELAILISETTQGAFDPTVKPALQIWNWRKGQFPSDSAIDSVKNIIGINKVELSKEESTVYLPKAGMKLDFGAIGKGYIADMVCKVWLEKGISGTVNCGGDLMNVRTANSSLSNVVQVLNPLDTTSYLYSLEIKNKAIVTSGNYFRSFKKYGKTYSHIINPKTCKPVENEIVSVTIIAPTAGLADGLATGITILGVEVGIDLINQLSGLDAIIVKSDGSEYVSKGIELLKN